MNNKFEFTRLETASFLNESIQAPKIKDGASSNSNILNRWIEAVRQDLITLTSRTNLLATRSDRLDRAMSAQSAALLSQVQNAVTTVNQASGLSSVLCSMHSSFFIQASQTTADIDYVYGQATLPVRNKTNLLLQNDVYGNFYVPDEIDIGYSFVTTPQEQDYTSDPEAIYMLRNEQAWIVAETNQPFYVKIKTPVQYQGLVPNLLELSPFPAFGMNITEIAYQAAGDGFTNAWIPLDLTYLPKYDAATEGGVIVKAGPIRVHLPNVNIGQLRIKFEPQSSLPCGIYSLNMFNVQYDTSATLTVKDPYSRLINSTSLIGKDPSNLSTLTVTYSGNLATVYLTTTDTSVTPVIEGVIMNL